MCAVWYATMNRNNIVSLLYSWMVYTIHYGWANIWIQEWFGEYIKYTTTRPDMKIELGLYNNMLRAHFCALYLAYRSQRMYYSVKCVWKTTKRYTIVGKLAILARHIHTHTQ